MLIDVLAIGVLNVRRPALQKCRLSLHRSMTIHWSVTCVAGAMEQGGRNVLKYALVTV
jgi:hypothetical protein